jgi:hypothetical protein
MSTTESASGASTTLVRRATLASTLGKVFFATDDAIVALLSSFAVFGSGFVVRPLDGASFGSVGDRIDCQKDPQTPLAART